MKDSLPIAVSLVALALFIFIGSFTVKPPPPPPPIVTPAILDCDPDNWLDQDVRVKTGGMEIINGEVVYRKFSDKPPILVCRFRAPIPNPLPPLITGRCKGRDGASVILTDCRP